MTVHCEGDCRLLEQLGEKQDFEAELSRLGFRHEDFTLHVLRRASESRNPQWNQSYAVTVTHVPTGRSYSYLGGPRQKWVARFTRDLATGPQSTPSHGRPPNGAS